MKIPIKKYVMNETLSWEERYKQLEAHHEKETQYLIAVIDAARALLDSNLCEDARKVLSGGKR